MKAQLGCAYPEQPHSDAYTLAPLSASGVSSVYGL